MKGRISINRSMNNQDNLLPIRIELEDDSSGIYFLSVDISLENFARVITGHGYVECDYKLTDSKNLGKQIQHKTVVIPLPEGGDQWTLDQLQDLITPYEVDGWKGDADDFKNWHNAVPGIRAFKITFVRWIEKNE